MLRGDVAGYHALLADSRRSGRARRDSSSVELGAWHDARRHPGARSRAAGRHAARRRLQRRRRRVQEFGDRARIATWWLEVRRRDAADGTEWRIADQKRLSSVENLYRLSLNPAKQFIARNLTFTDEDLELTLIEGSVFVSEIDQGTTALVLLGRGEMHFARRRTREKSQVRIFSGAEAIETPFDAAYIRVDPGDFDRLLSSGQLVGDAGRTERAAGGRTDLPRGLAEVVQPGPRRSLARHMVARAEPSRFRRRNPYPAVRHA